MAIGILGVHHQRLAQRAFQCGAGIRPQPGQHIGRHRFTPRQKVGGGNPTRLRQVWDEHLASNSVAQAQPVAELPVEVAEEVAKPKKKEKKKDAHAVPAFINLDPFTVNLVPETGDQYLQVALSLELEDIVEEPALKAVMPKIRNNITLLLSSKKASELMPKEGKEQLAESLRDEINSVIEPPKKNKKGELVMPEGPVKSVLFTSFIIQ